MFGSRRRRKKTVRRAAAAPRPRWWLWVVAATAVAALLRLHEIGTWSLWIDEAHTFRDATMPLDGENGFWAQDRAWYPLTYLGLRFALDMGWLSTGEGALRLPFALFGIATVPAMWLCGRRLVGEPAAIFAAWLLALMPWHLYWSQNARGYVFVVLSAAIVAAAAWRWQTDGRRRYLLFALGAIGLGTLFHSTASLQLLGLVVFALLRRRELGGRALIVAVVVACAVLATLPIAVRELSPFQAFLRSNANASIAHFSMTTGYFFRPLLLVAALAGFFLVRRRHGRERALLLACLAATPLVVLAAVGSTVAQTTARYAICALPALVWLAAFAAAELASLEKAPAGSRGPALGARLLPLFLGFALIADFAAGSWRYFAYHHGDRARWREACRFVQRRYEGQRVHALSINEPTVRYYLDRDYWRNGGVADEAMQVRVLADWLVRGKAKDGSEIHPAGGAPHLRWQLEEARRNEAELVVLVTLPALRENDVDGSLWRTLRADFELALHLPCWVGPKDESIYVFVPAES